MVSYKNGYRIGDTIRCTALNKYVTYDYGSLAKVLDVKEGTQGDTLVLLNNPMSDTGIGWYYAYNFEVINRLNSKQRFQLHQAKREEQMTNAYEKTSYFGVKLVTCDPSSFLAIDPEGQTVLRPTKHEAIKDVQSAISIGERWMVLQTVALIEPQDPRPPIIITEYK